MIRVPNPTIDGLAVPIQFGSMDYRPRLRPIDIRAACRNLRLETETMTTLTVKVFDRGAGSHKTIVESPWAEALAVIDGLACARNNATYGGVLFGRQRQAELVIYLDVDYQTPEWEQIKKAGVGPYTFDDAYLDRILAVAGKIKTAIARAVPAGPDYPCREQKNGCAARVKIQGSYCPSCRHDA